MTNLIASFISDLFSSGQHQQPDMAVDASESISSDMDIRDVATLFEHGVLTPDDGVVLRLNDGREFHITVVQSK